MKALALSLSLALCSCAGYNLKGSLSYEGQYGYYKVTKDGKTFDVEVTPKQLRGYSK